LILDEDTVLNGHEEILTALDQRFRGPAEAARHREKAVEEAPSGYGWLRSGSRPHFLQ